VLLAAQAPAGPPVRVWLGSGRTLASGDPARVYVQTSSDGNLVVLHAHADGRVEVLFPGEPASDPFVRAGTYEIRGPSGGEAFAASGPEGGGIVVAALSPDPMWFDEFVHNNNWDAAALSGAGAGGDPEALLTDVVQRMLGDGSFNYDVVTYAVAPPPAAVALQPAVMCIECSFTRVDLLPFSHRRRRAPDAPAVGPAVSPVPPAIAVYSAHRATAATRSLLLMRVTRGARRPDPVSSGVVAVSARVLAAPARITATGGLVAVAATVPGFVAATAHRVEARPDRLTGRTPAPQAGLAAPASARAASVAGVGFGSLPYRRVAAPEMR
jgi:hypothetical protein